MVRRRSLRKILGIISIIGTGFVFITATNTQAGFEWVPAKKETSPMVTAPAPSPVAPVIIEPQDNAPTALMPAPISSKVDMAPPPAVNMPPMDVQPAYEPQPTIKVIRPKQADLAPPPPQETSQDKVIWSQEQRAIDAPAAAPEQIRRKRPIRTVSEVAPPRTAAAVRTKIIMPDDAPESAMSKTSNAERLNVENNISEKKPAIIIKSEPVITEAPMMDNAAAVAYEQAVGFGSDMPLAYALTQIVPAGYAYSFASNVNPGQTVSWNGGKPWNEVVADMVAPLGLYAKIEGKKILVYKLLQPAKHSAVKTEPAPKAQITAKAQATQAIDAPIELTKVETKRLNIKNPTQNISAQPKETMVKIERIAEAQQINNVSDIEPAAGLEKASTNTSAYKDMQFWQGQKGASVKDLLNKWSDRADVDFVWDMKHDLTLSNNILINDNFENALKTVLTTALNEEFPPSITLMETPGADKSAKLVIKQQNNS